jgi:hypothetical protein
MPDEPTSLLFIVDRLQMLVHNSMLDIAAGDGSLYFYATTVHHFHYTII